MIPLTKHYSKQNSHHYINTPLQTLLSRHYTPKRTPPCISSRSLTPPPCASRCPLLSPSLGSGANNGHLEAHPPTALHVLPQRTGAKWALHMGAPILRLSSLPRTACPRLAPCGGRSGRGAPRPLRLSSVRPPCMGAGVSTLLPCMASRSFLPTGTPRWWLIATSVGGHPLPACLGAVPPSCDAPFHRFLSSLPRTCRNHNIHYV